MSESAELIPSQIFYSAIKVPNSELEDDKLITEVDRLNQRFGDKVTPGVIDDHIASVRFIYIRSTTLTICVITLKNGWAVVGESAAMSPERYDQGLGETFAYANARNKASGFIAYAKVDAAFRG